jgi:Protein of unknown function (DUF3185)
MNQIIGAALLAVGAVLLVFAYQASNAPLDQVVNTITGHYTQQTVWYFVLGVASVVIGGLLVLRGSRR